MQSVMRMILKCGVSLAALTAIGACSGRDRSTADTAAPTPVDSPATAKTTRASGAVTDPQIAAVIVAANNADIEAGRLAATSSTNAKIKESHSA